MQTNNEKKKNEGKRLNLSSPRTKSWRFDMLSIGEHGESLLVELKILKLETTHVYVV